MNTEAYDAVRNTRSGAGYCDLPRAMIKVWGRDRVSFLQGQVSNDVLALQPGDGTRACLLNNTGHMLADLAIFAFDGHFIIETDMERGRTVIDTLERFIVREKVVIEDVTEHWQIITLQGDGATAAWERVDGTPLAIADSAQYAHVPLPFTALDGADHGEIVKRDRVGAPGGYDIWLPTSIAVEIVAALSDVPGVILIPAETFDTLRIEARRPAWGTELTETVIPLEAELYDALSFTKGCYMGQEIIARINSRGHTNRTLRPLSLTAPAIAGATVTGGLGEREGAEIGRVTSATVSPTVGPIALAYVRKEYEAPGSQVFVDGVPAIVAE